jgi:AcrR family transcriptional regulator
MARPRQVSDEEVFAAVREAVLQQGPQVSLDVVAERIGVTAPALFRRFGSRHEILLQSLRPPERPPFLEVLAKGPDDRPITEQLIEVFTQFGHFVVETLPCMSALRESGLPFEKIHGSFEEPPPVRTLRALSGWLQRAADRKLLRISDATATATAMLGAVHMPVFLKHVAKDASPHDPRAFAEMLANLFLEGIAR